MNENSMQVFDKMMKSDMNGYIEAKEHKYNFVRLWFEKHMSQYGAFVPTGEGEFIIEFPTPARGKSLCEPSRIPVEGISVNGFDFSMAEIGVAYELLNDYEED